MRKVVQWLIYPKIEMILVNVMYSRKTIIYMLVYDIKQFKIARLITKCCKRKERIK